MNSEPGRMADDPSFFLLTNNPDLVALHEAFPKRYPHLLESAAVGQQGRYDILFAFPGESIELRDAGAFDFLDALDRAWRAEKVMDLPGQNAELPFHGGWFLYLSYELVGQIEQRLELPKENSDLPIASATRFPAAIIYDRLSGQTTLVSEQKELFETMLEDIDHLPVLKEQPDSIAINLQEDPAVDWIGRRFNFDL
jgi:anthranilate synthase component 1